MRNTETDSGILAPVFSEIVETRALPPTANLDFDVRPSRAARDAIAAYLGIVAIRKLTFAGHLAPEARRDWRLSGKLGASVVQSCVVTSSDVPARIDIRVRRRFVADLAEPAPAEETEFDGITEIEQLPARIDLGQIAIEELALALPDYPRLPGMRLEAAGLLAPDDPDNPDPADQPFAALAELRDKMKK